MLLQIGLFTGAWNQFVRSHCCVNTTPTHGTLCKCCLLSGQYSDMVSFKTEMLYNDQTYSLVAIHGKELVFVMETPCFCYFSKIHYFYCDFFRCSRYCCRYGVIVGCGELLHLLQNPNALDAISIGMQAAEHFLTKSSQFLTGGANWHKLTCVVCVW